uniref:GRF-type domain-containing protein n=1 Tax=Nicotiana tabacum TaxID=4097 RepID=A0A1S3XHB1_TOBAC|nr:PREDICTED: uncharacterized protein LOC107765207 [Nicotiana tabacum]
MSLVHEMSQSSSSSYGCKRMCLCGIVALHLMSKTPENPGRHFFRCPKPDNKGSCGYWEWKDDKFSSRALVVINKLKREKEALVRKTDFLQKKSDDLHIEINVLKGKVVAFEGSSIDHDRVVAKLKEKLFW